MTDRLHSPSGWGGVPVTPEHEVSLPPLAAPYQYPYPGDARIEAESALIAAGLVDPDDGTVPRWRRGDSIPVWTNPMHVVDTVLAAALPHLQVETRAKVAEEIAVRLDRIVENVGHAVGPNEFEVGAGAVLGSYRHAAQIARDIGKGDPNE